MALIVDDFREYLQFYLKDYMVGEQLDWTRPNWGRIVEKIELLSEKDGRFRNLLFFLWTMNDELIRDYRSNKKRQTILRKAMKVCSIIDGEFLRFNDYETKIFVSELQKMSGIDLAMAQKDPGSPDYEDLIHFIGNFIDWHKKKRGIPLTLW